MTERPIQLPKIRRKVLGDQLETHIRALPGPSPISVYRGEVRGTPPALEDDPAGRVAAYAVLFDGTGPTDLEPALQDCGEQLRWTPTMTIAAGYTTDCTQAVDRIYAWCLHWQPTIPGVAAGRLALPPGFDPGQPRPDRTAQPVRFFVSLSWQIDLTT